MTALVPVIFFGHGNPMNALLKNGYTEGWGSIGKSIPRPKAVVAVSAHWYIPACAVTANLVPPTIHDFGGFPRELYRVQYPAPGSIELALRVKDVIALVPVDLMNVGARSRNMVSAESCFSRSGYPRCSTEYR